MKPVRLDNEAKEELAGAIDWYDQRRPGLGRKFLESVKETLALIEESPSVGTPMSGVSAELGVRKVLVRRFPYSVVLLELEEEIRVLAIAHSRRRPGYWRKRAQS